MSNTILKAAALLTAMASATQLSAQATGQEGGLAPPPAAETVNNGTNPTLLTTRAGVQYQYNSINSDLDTGLFEAYYTQPIGRAKTMALEFTVPFANGPFNTDHALGDVSMKFVHVLDVNASRGIAYSAEVFLDTADRADIGNGQAVLEMSAFYAKFLKNRSIFAPALVQTMGLEGGDALGREINRTAIDFYYVPKLANPKYFVTFDPSLSYDWNTEKSFGSLQVTLGMLTGKAFGGDAQVFVKPGIYVGEDRPLDYSLQVGVRVLNF